MHILASKHNLVVNLLRHAFQGINALFIIFPTVAMILLTVCFIKLLFVFLWSCLWVKRVCMCRHLLAVKLLSGVECFQNHLSSCFAVLALGKFIGFEESVDPEPLKSCLNYVPDCKSCYWHTFNRLEICEENKQIIMWDTYYYIGQIKGK